MKTERNPKGSGRKRTGRKRVVRYWTPQEITIADQLVSLMRQLKGEQISPPITERDRALQLEAYAGIHPDYIPTDLRDWVIKKTQQDP